MKVKVKLALEQATKPPRWRYSSVLSSTSALDGGVGGQRHAPTAFNAGKDPVPIVQETGWAPGPVLTGAENLVLSGFDPRIVQPVKIHYTYWATPAPFISVCFIYLRFIRGNYNLKILGTGSIFR